MKEILLAHLKQYPQMQLQDVVKLLYQSEFGGGHDGISTQLPKGKAEEFVALIIQHLFNN